MGILEHVVSFGTASLFLYRPEESEMLRSSQIQAARTSSVIFRVVHFNIEQSQTQTEN